MSKQNEVEIGSSSFHYEIPKERGIRVKIFFSLESVGLITRRFYDNTYLLLISAIIGSATGIVSIGGYFMGKVEDKVNSVSKKLSTENFLSRIINSKRKLINNFNFKPIANMKILYEDETSISQTIFN